MTQEEKKLILFINKIEKLYCEINNKWIEDHRYYKFNLKKTLIINFQYNVILLNTITNYREFLNENTDKLLEIQDNQSNNITWRVKAQDSIQYKINNYINNITGNHENRRSKYQ